MTMQFRYIDTDKNAQILRDTLYNFARHSDVLINHLDARKDENDKLIHTFEAIIPLSQRKVSLSPSGLESELEAILTGRKSRFYVKKVISILRYLESTGIEIMTPEGKFRPITLPQFDPPKRKRKGSPPPKSTTAPNYKNPKDFAFHQCHLSIETKQSKIIEHIAAEASRKLLKLRQLNKMSNERFDNQGKDEVTEIKIAFDLALKSKLTKEL